MNATGRQMVFSCSWAVYWTECAAQNLPKDWQTQCGRIPWENDLITDSCHMWRYGEDLRPYWGEGAAAPVTSIADPKITGSGSSFVDNGRW